MQESVNTALIVPGPSQYPSVNLDSLRSRNVAVAFDKANTKRTDRVVKKD